MKKPTSSEFLLRRNGGLAFVITVLIAYAQWLSAGIHPILSVRGISLLILGILYLGLGLILINKDTPDSKIVILGYIAVQLLLGLAIVFLGEGSTVLAILPLISQIVIILPRRDALPLIGMVYLVLLLILNVWKGDKFDWTLAFGLFCGMVFVILFSQVVLSEQNIRAEVETLNAELSVANQKLQEYSVQVEELATVQERNRLAREIHDGLGHYLTALNMQVKAAQAVLNQDPPRAMDALTKAQTLAEGALADVRQSVAALRGEPTLNQPLPVALDSLLKEYRGEGLVAELSITGNYRLLTSQADLTLYRVTQEALTNVRKHALASRVDVTLLYEVNRVCLTVCDNGIGTDKSEGGFGLFGLRERVQLLHGSMSIRTAPRQGFCIEVELPV